jgi:hypothetical protein
VGFTRGSIFLAKMMDCRVKPGNDEIERSGMRSRPSLH